MKNIYFKRKDSVLRSLQEEKKKKPVRKINWDRVIYFILLSIFLFFVGRYAFMKIYYVKADGQILFKNLNIQNLDDCRITKFVVSEGNYVHKGDTLFYFINDEDGDQEGNASAQISFAGKTKTDWQDKAIIELEADLDILKKELRIKRKQASKLEAELIQIQQEVLLEVLPKSSLYQKQSELDKVNSEIDGLLEERTILNEKLAKIKSSERNLGEFNGSGLGSGSGDENQLQPFISPMEGIITKIFKENQEVALKSEVIMYIQKSENVFIKAFFEQEDLKYLKNRNKVEIEFPDGTECYGRITRFYYSTYRLPEEFQKKYEPTTRSLSVDIVPLNRQEFLKWQKFYKLGVIVRKVRF
jgi:multidrug resistance efflux pump